MASWSYVGEPYLKEGKDYCVDYEADGLDPANGYWAEFSCWGMGGGLNPEGTTKRSGTLCTNLYGLFSNCGAVLQLQLMQITPGGAISVVDTANVPLPPIATIKDAEVYWEGDYVRMILEVESEWLGQLQLMADFSDYPLTRYYSKGAPIDPDTGIATTRSKYAPEGSTVVMEPFGILREPLHNSIVHVFNGKKSLTIPPKPCDPRFEGGASGITADETGKTKTIYPSYDLKNPLDLRTTNTMTVFMTVRNDLNRSCQVLWEFYTADVVLASMMFPLIGNETKYTEQTVNVADIPSTPPDPTECRFRLLYEYAPGKWSPIESSLGYYVFKLLVPSLPNFEFVEEECFIQYGDELFCFADETKDIPPGTDIRTYFKVKNTGETAARATVKVFDGDTKLCEKTSPGEIPPGSSADFYTFCFNMSDTNRDLVMKVYEYGKTEELDSLGCK